ncbi:hypothetical protein PU707_002761 [Cronobacter sakazakii]|uniref:hypothetical protein n=1 Tax=Cronobacter TaxID=413496 RepID=UPI001AE9C313|nr:MULTISPECIES: hypothetical protein [Cronobacter]EKM0528792.1 hypothetical protein [Cronobacter turicensis]EKK7716818.1 hypothetical protein [Cronobacter dublinensis]EKM6345076.1 hypothetical protein [Cronobacter sakazakii]EKM6354395.1 hypothetical protein [Cronobacter sakazakii]EKM6370380.1 hypothetical protein [Cronobacter sakazakii]
MREDVELRVRAFRKALELARDCPEECGHLGRWKTELHNFPRGSCDMASNCLAQYLKDKKCGHPCIIYMNGSGLENSPVRAHVIVMLDGEYIDLTLDQFDGYADYIVSEPIESQGEIGTLLRRIGEIEGTIKTRPIDLSSNWGGGDDMYVWLRDKADQILEEEKNRAVDTEPGCPVEKIIIGYTEQD